MSMSFKAHKQIAIKTESVKYPGLHDYKIVMNL